MSATPEDDPHQNDLPPTGAQPVGGDPTLPPEPSGEDAIALKGYFYQRGHQVGAYTLRSPLGKGGFGEVWRAERRNPNMTAAVKLIRPDRADDASLARFSAECQALALLDHPGIARIHDAGVSADGSPYLAMEYIHGVPLAEFCDREKLSIVARLGLLAEIADAVHHAHTQGIIHRDLKPENILVTIHEGGEPSPRIVDFGIAKAVNKNVRLTDMTITHDLNTMIGTPSYMSPEQLESTQAGVDTRTDIFALGVICYELLAGVLPLSDRDDASGLEGMLRLIRAERPEPIVRYAQLPSDNREAIAYRRAELTPVQLERVLRTRVRHIPMKAMRPERHKRFSSAAAMAQDIRHYLADEDFVEAAAESRVERVTRSIRRNKAGYGAAGAFLVLLIGGAISTTIGMQMAIRAEAEARDEAERANTAEKQAASEAERARLAEEQANRRADDLLLVSEFQRSLLAGINPALMGARIRDDFAAELVSSWRRSGLSEQERGELREAFEQLSQAMNPTNLAIQTLDRNIFDQTLRAIDERFIGQPILRAQLLASTAVTMQQVGLLDRAHIAQSRALEVFEQVLGPNDPETIAASIGLAGILSDAGDSAAAKDLLSEAIARCESRDDLESIGLSAKASYAGVLVDMGRVDDAEREAVEVLSARLDRHGELHADTLQSLGSVGYILVAQGRLREAEPYYRRTLEGRRELLGDEHQDTITAANNLGYLLQQLAEYPEAEALMREVLDRRRRILGDEHPSTLTARTNLAGLLRATGRAAEAKPLYEEALAGRRRVLGLDHPDTLAAMNNLGVLLHQSLAKPELAEPFLRDAYAGRLHVLGPDHPSTLISQVNIGVMLLDRDKNEEARDLLSQAVETYTRTLGGQHPSTLAAKLNLGAAQKALNDFANAERTLQQALSDSIAALGQTHPTTLRIGHDLADALARQSKFAPAEEHFAEVHRLRSQTLGEYDAATLASLKALGDVRIARGNASGAAEAYRQLLDAHTRDGSQTREEGVATANALAIALRRAGDASGAAQGMRRALDLNRELQGDDHPSTLTLRSSVAEYLIVAGEYEQAETVLSAGEALARSAWASDRSGRLGVYLFRLGLSQGAQGKLREAERSLLDAHAVFESTIGAGHQLALDAAAQIAHLYDALHQSEPGEGYDQRAAIWRSQAQRR